MHSVGGYVGWVGPGQTNSSGRTGSVRNNTLHIGIYIHYKYDLYRWQQLRNPDISLFKTRKHLEIKEFGK